MRRRPCQALVSGVCALFAVAVVAAAPAAADDIARGTYCGAHGVFKVVQGKIQIHYIVDTQGRQTYEHNGGCFGIAYNGTVWWTSRTNPKWREMEGDGVAEWTGHSDIRDGLQTVSVKTAAGNYYYQWWYPPYGWNDTWYPTDH